MKQRKWLGIVVLAVAVVCLVPGLSIGDQNDRKEMETWIKEAFQKGDIAYEKLDFGQEDYDARLTGVTITSNEDDRSLSIDEITFIRADIKHMPPHLLDLSVKGMHVNADLLEGRFKKAFRSREIDEILVDMDIKYQHDPEARTLALEKLHLSAQTLGDLSLALTVDNIHLWSAEDRSTFLRFLVGIPSVALKSANVDFEDDGLVDLVVANRAQKTGQTEEEVLAGAIEKIDMDIEKAKSETTRKNLAQIKKFILDPDKFEVRILPESPIKIKDMRHLKDNVLEDDILGITVKAK